MWRRGERLYALLVFLVVALEALALGKLVLVFSGRLFHLLGYPQAQQALLEALFLTGVALILLSAYIPLYHAYTETKELWDRKVFEEWVSRFSLALFGEAALPPPPWPRLALEALYVSGRLWRETAASALKPGFARPTLAGIRF
jgi:hypothetical protein